MPRLRPEQIGNHDPSRKTLHSRSIVPGGSSYTTRFTPFNSLIIRVAGMAACSKAWPRTGGAGLLDAPARPEHVLLGDHRPPDRQTDRQTPNKSAMNRGLRLP